MKYSIANITYEPMEIDDAYVFFYFDVLFEEPEVLTASSSYPFSRLLSYIESKHPEFYTYLEKVRLGLDNWGPDESEIMEAIGEEGVNLLYVYLEEELLTCNWMESVYKKEVEWKKMSESQQIETVQKVEEIADDLEDSASDIINDQKRYRQFCKLIEKEAKRIAVEVYPELLDASVEQIKEFKYIFTNGIMRMHDDLSSYLDKIE